MFIKSDLITAKWHLEMLSLQQSREEKSSRRHDTINQFKH